MAVAKAKVISFLREKKKYLVPEQAVDLLLLLFRPAGMCEKSAIHAVTEPICMIN